MDGHQWSESVHNRDHRNRQVCVCVTASVSSVPVHSPDRHVVGDVGDVSAPVCIWQLFDLQSEEPDGGEA